MRLFLKKYKQINSVLCATVLGKHKIYEEYNKPTSFDDALWHPGRHFLQELKGAFYDENEIGTYVFDSGGLLQPRSLLSTTIKSIGNE